MSAIDNDNWCYVSRSAVESLGWDLDENRKGPEDDRPTLECAGNGESVTIYDGSTDETMKTTWITSDMHSKVER